MAARQPAVVENPLDFGEVKAIVDAVGFTWPLKAWEPVLVVEKSGKSAYFDLTVKVLDTNTGNPTRLNSGHSVPFDCLTSRGDVLDACREVMLQLLEHELDESLTFNGERVNDPHANEGKGHG